MRSKSGGQSSAQHHLPPALKFSKDLLSTCSVLSPNSCILLTTTEIPRLRISLPTLQRRKLKHKEAPTAAHPQQAATLMPLPWEAAPAGLGSSVMLPQLLSGFS